MRAFIVSCLLSLAMASPQGYSYQTQHQPQQQQLQLQPGRLQLPAIPQIATFEEQQILQQALQAPRVQQVLSGSTGSSVSYNTAASQPAIYHQQQQIGSQLQQFVPQQQQFVPQQQQFVQQQQFSAQPQFVPQQQQQQQTNFGHNILPQQQQYQQQLLQHYSPSLVSKDIYVHVPPVEDAEEQYAQPALPLAPPRKHYRIVFIKAPTPSIKKQSLRIQQAPTEEKTIIYVLTKKADPLELQAAFEQAAPKPPSKPEVFFIKYKTQAEAAHAQRTIQAQYDQLGGTTQISDEGVAPVTSVIGALDNQRVVATAGASNGVNGAIGAVPSKYLPAHLRA